MVTREVEKQLPEMAKVKVGMANLFIKHTSASLSINENCDSDVRCVVVPIGYMNMADRLWLGDR